MRYSEGAPDTPRDRQDHTQASDCHTLPRVADDDYDNTSSLIHNDNTLNISDTFSREAICAVG